MVGAAPGACRRMTGRGELPLEVVLASASPRRQELLRAVRVPFRVVVTDADENVTGLSPEATVVALAERKAAAALELLRNQPLGTGARRLVIAADTVVALDDEILGKPGDSEDARQMLQALSGRDHRVLTGLALVLQAREATEDLLKETRASGYEETRVRFAPLSREEIEVYLESGEPLDKAGAYGIQGQAAFFVEEIAGCYFNVVGLPLRKLYTLATSLGVPSLQHPPG